jgi:hypothetical protein
VIRVQPGATFTLQVGIGKTDGSSAGRISIRADGAPVAFVKATANSANGNMVTEPQKIDGRFSIINLGGIVPGNIGAVTFKADENAAIGSKHQILFVGDNAITETTGSVILEIGSPRIPGDANEDGYADLFDALLVLQYDAGWDVSINESNADVNADGWADLFDALIILQYDAGWDVTLQ